ncbi:MAG TPA: hypothetical protein VHE32_13180 [Rhodanobacteraceae bacterium]|nr:hypothetical protein [Rhodanobacteraceae bacterium]
MRRQSLNEAHAPHPLLLDLPVFEPDATLWPRIVAARAAAGAPKRQRVSWLIGAAAAAAVFATLLAVMPHAPTESPLAESQRESQSLEREWHALSPATAQPAGLTRLHVIDANLQSAYDRGAEADELGPLWKQRNDALRGLILAARADAVTRI